MKCPSKCETRHLSYFEVFWLGIPSSKIDIWNFLVFQSLEHLRSQRKHPSCSSGLANNSHKPSSFLSVLNTAQLQPLPLPGMQMCLSVCFWASRLTGTRPWTERGAHVSLTSWRGSSRSLTFACYSPSVPWIRTLWLLVTPVKWLSHTTYHLEKGIDKL